MSSWLAGQRPALAAALSPGADASALLVMANAPGLRGKLTYAFRLVVPSRDYLRWRYGAEGQHGTVRVYGRRIAQGLRRFPKAAYALVGGALRGR